MHTDPIADMLTRIRNAQMVKKFEVVLPFSKLKFNVAKLLAGEKWLGEVKIVEPQTSIKASAKNRREIEARFKQIKIELLYENNKPKITNIQRISKPGRRMYVGKNDMPVILNNFGIAIVSTPQGLMTNKQAKQKGIGGELMCQIY